MHATVHPAIPQYLYNTPLFPPSSFPPLRSRLFLLVLLYLFFTGILPPAAALQYTRTAVTHSGTSAFFIFYSVCYIPINNFHARHNRAPPFPQRLLPALFYFLNTVLNPYILVYIFADMSFYFIPPDIILARQFLPSLLLFSTATRLTNTQAVGRLILYRYRYLITSTNGLQDRSKCHTSASKDNGEPPNFHHMLPMLIC